MVYLLADMTSALLLCRISMQYVASGVSVSSTCITIYVRDKDDKEDRGLARAAYCMERVTATRSPTYADAIHKKADQVHRQSERSGNEADDQTG